MLGTSGRLAAVGIVFGLIACSEVPQESVELSATLGRDLAEVRRANRELAVRYFDRMKRDIDQFVDEKYRPFVIQRSLQEFRLLDKIKPAALPGADRQTTDSAFVDLEVYVELVSEEVEAYRSELLAHIEAQEDEVLGAIDDSFQALQNANAIVTGHLMSVRKVRDVQAELLSRASLEGLRERFIAGTVDLSEKIAGLVERARKGEQAVDKAAGQLVRIVDRTAGAPVVEPASGNAE